MKVTFLGTGTSQGVPVIGCHCDVCRSVDPKDKRLRTSVLIEDNGTTIVIDTGPDFRTQMLRENVQQLDAVVFTHSHKDHTAGMDDVRPFNFKQQKAMDIYATPDVQEVLKKEFAYVFAEKKYPGVPEIKLHTINNRPFMVQDVEIIPIQVFHYKLPVFGFRVKDFTYITDANLIPEEEKKKAKGSKVLVLNALRKEKHISHFNLKEAQALVEELQPEQAYFTHISHQLGKHAQVNEELPQNVKLAYDGLKIEM